jgi:hypothetical protein
MTGRRKVCFCSSSIGLCLTCSVIGKPLAFHTTLGARCMCIRCAIYHSAARCTIAIFFRNQAGGLRWHSWCDFTFGRGTASDLGGSVSAAPCRRFIKAHLHSPDPPLNSALCFSIFCFEKGLWYCPRRSRSLSNSQFRFQGCPAALKSILKPCRFVSI